jgi:hypothetical protein
MYRCWKKKQRWIMTGPSSWHGSALDFLWFQVHCSSVLLPAYIQSARQRKRRMCSTLCQVCTAVGFTTFQGAESMVLHFSYCYTAMLNNPGMGIDWMKILGPSNVCNIWISAILRKSWTFEINLFNIVVHPAYVIFNNILIIIIVVILLLDQSTQRFFMLIIFIKH